MKKNIFSLLFFFFLVNSFGVNTIEIINENNFKINNEPCSVTLKEVVNGKTFTVTCNRVTNCDDAYDCAKAEMKKRVKSLQTAE